MCGTELLNGSAKDVGKPKAEVAAAFVEARVPGVKITPHIGFVQSMDDDFYKQFKLVLGGLDNLDARRWINAKLCSFVEVKEFLKVVETRVLFDVLMLWWWGLVGRRRLTKMVRTLGRSFLSLTVARKVWIVLRFSVIPLLLCDAHGGRAGLKGQVKLMLPKISSCFECGLDAFPPETTFAMCTIAERPRKPEHCVAYAMMVLWDRAFVSDESHALPKPPPPNAVARKYDTDSPADMRWIYERAAERAAEFGITGVDYMMTLVRCFRARHRFHRLTNLKMSPAGRCEEYYSSSGIDECHHICTRCGGGGEVGHVLQPVPEQLLFLHGPGGGQHLHVLHGAQGRLPCVPATEVFYGTLAPYPVARRAGETGTGEVRLRVTPSSMWITERVCVHRSLKKAALMRSTGGYLYMPSGKYLADTKYDMHFCFPPIPCSCLVVIVWCLIFCRPNLDKSLEELGIVDGSELVVDDETLPVGLVLVIRLVPVA